MEVTKHILQAIFKVIKCIVKVRWGEIIDIVQVRMKAITLIEQERSLVMINIVQL